MLLSIGVVSGQKKRFQDGPDGFDLDLAYISPRIIAMGLPAQGKDGERMQLKACMPARAECIPHPSQGKTPCNCMHHTNSATLSILPTSLLLLLCAVLYRNPMQEIARFLQTYHRGHAKVYNLCSEHTYSPEHLSVAFQQLPHDDHQVCAGSRVVLVTQTVYTQQSRSCTAMN